MTIKHLYRVYDVIRIPSERQDFHLVPTVSSIRGQMPVSDTSADIPFESALERNFLQLCYSENQVVNVEAQPFTLKFKEISSEKQRKYTPDFLVYFDRSRKRTWGPHFDKPCLVEVKPLKMLWKHRHKLVPKFHAAAIWCAQNDMTFHLVTENWLDGRIVKNAELLNSSLIVGENEKYETAVKDYLDGTFGVDIFELLFEMESRDFDRGSLIRAIFRCIAIGEVDAALFQPLNKKSMIEYIYGENPIIPFV